ncbi:MAG: MBL fold metallo-hydrolase [Elusimicrobiaceae bacterium]|nr:MBL fold metallo-hydrolase [Elusimicrobiaceae bacterium]
MRIKFWGVRGSIAVSGPKYNRYGGDTACVEVTGSSGETVILDAGTGIRRLGLELARRKVRSCHILFTHFHWDHILGFPFFAPIYSKKCSVVFTGCPHSGQSVNDMIAKTMEPPNFPVPYDTVSASFSEQPMCRDRFVAGGMTVQAVPLSHPNGGSGYKFTENGRSFVFLTDNELGFKHPGGLSRAGYAKFCRNADLLVHDGEYTATEYTARRGWGHSNAEAAVALALKSGAKRLALYHHNQERTDDAIDAIVGSCRKLAAGSELGIFAAADNMELEV